MSTPVILALGPPPELVFAVLAVWAVIGYGLPALSCLSRHRGHFRPALVYALLGVCVNSLLSLLWFSEAGSKFPLVGLGLGLVPLLAGIATLVAALQVDEGSRGQNPVNGGPTGQTDSQSKRSGDNSAAESDGGEAT